MGRNHDDQLKTEGRNVDIFVKTNAILEGSKDYFIELLKDEIHKSKQQSAFFQTAEPFVEE